MRIWALVASTVHGRDLIQGDQSAPPLPHTTSNPLSYKFGGGLISFCYAGLYYIQTIVKKSDLHMADQIHQLQSVEDLNSGQQTNHWATPPPSWRDFKTIPSAFPSGPSGL